MSEFVAFSLTVAQGFISSAATDWRVTRPDVLNLSGITKVLGVVHLEDQDDLLLIGLRKSEGPNASLDDFATAMRARFVHSQWPSVSIDPAPEGGDPEVQSVRFDGRIENTQFAQDLFEADYLLKQLSLGFYPTNLYGIDDWWTVAVAEARASSNVHRRIHSRYWLYPVSSSVTVRAGVASLGEVRVGVFTEILSAEIEGQAVLDTRLLGERHARFAEQMTANYESLSRAFPSFARVKLLTEFVALTRALEEMENLPDLRFWLHDYRVPIVATPQETRVLRHGDILDWPESDFSAFAQRALRDYGKPCHYLELSGGVVLAALAARLRAGDVTAMRDAALCTRPHQRSLSWTFVATDWVIPTTERQLDLDALESLFLHAMFLQDQNRHDEATSCYDAIIRENGDWPEAYMHRGNSHAKQARYRLALADFDAAIRLDPKLAVAYYNRGTVQLSEERYDEAIADFDTAISLNHDLLQAFHNRGIAYGKGRQAYGRAIDDLEQALLLDSERPEIHNSLGMVYKLQGSYSRGVMSFDNAISLDPGYAEAYNNRGLCRFHMGQDDAAVEDYTRAIALNPTYAEAFYNRVNPRARKGDFALALDDCDKATALGIASIKREYAAVHFNKGMICMRLGREREACEAFRAFVACVPVCYRAEIKQAQAAIASLEGHRQ